MAKCKLIERKPNLINRVNNKLKIILNIFLKINLNKLLKSKKAIKSDKPTRNRYGFPMSRPDLNNK
jgi:hypothetical protein